MREAQLTAVAILGRVLTGQRLDNEFAAAWRGHPIFSVQQRALVQELCYGSLRHLGTLDVILGLLLEKPLPNKKLQQLLRIALYQLGHTRAAPHAVVDHAVSACDSLRAPAAKGLVNAVLRNFLRRRAELEGSAKCTDEGRFSYPQWWIDRIRMQHPREYAAVLDAGNVHAPLTLRVNARRTTPADYLVMLADHDIAAAAVEDCAVVLDKALPVERIPGFGAGLVSVQDVSAQRAAPLLDAAAGMRVLDACAAPGGKTAHILERADVKLTALDSEHERLARVASNLARLGLAAQIVCGDARDSASWWDGREFDRILLDAPCSASGVVRRHPDIKWHRRASDIARFAAQQAQMLAALWRLLARGGKLLYATCSVFEQENRLLITQFLECHADAIHLQFPGDHANNPGQIIPDMLHDGFYYALLRKD